MLMPMRQNSNLTKSIVRLLLLPLVSAAFATGAVASETVQPTLFIIGDSTVNTSGHGLQGWGTPIANLFDTNKINVENRAIGGRSSRSFFSEGRWDKSQRGHARHGDADPAQRLGGWQNSSVQR
jgi:lysophospholipase L1-like esterase